MIRGIQKNQEHAAQQVSRDTRPLGVRAAEFLSNPNTMFVLSGVGITINFLFPLACEVIFIILTGVFIFAYTRKHVLPFRLPMSCKEKDYNDLKPGTTSARMAGGISFFGNDRITNEELWFTNDDLRTHVLIFGSTGSGKTEALVSIAFNSLMHGSGFIYVDGKGDNSLFAKIFSMVRSMGREDDMLLVNFMTGARDVIGPQTTRLSNTMNPFAIGSSSMLSQLVISLMDSASNNQGGDMWKGRAMVFVEALMKVLTAMRDSGHILLDANSIRNYFQLEKLEKIAIDKLFPASDTIDINIQGYPEVVIEPMKNYLATLPGYNPQNKYNQAGEVREQHGFITMQLTRLFSSLADTYGHIIRTNLAEVDMKDVVLNRRILVVLLPALEKAPEELANLGKIIVASLKSMMASGLGDSVEGSYRDVILRKPTNAASPYVCIMDEYGYYAVPGFAVVPAQARSLGFSAIFAGQDLPAFQKASKEEAASICANTNVKICMKLEDPQETWEFFNKVAGEAYVTNVSGFQMNPGSITMNYMDSRNASVDRRARIEILDLKDQREGEAHIFFKSSIIRAEMFFANPQPVAKMRINHLLKVETPPEQELIAINQRLYHFHTVFNNNTQELSSKFNEHIDILAECFGNLTDNDPIERGLAGLIAILENYLNKNKNNEVIDDEYSTDNYGSISIFAKTPVSELVTRLIGEENIPYFSLPLLKRDFALEQIKNIERILGKDSEQADYIANNLVDDLEKITKFPPDIEFAQDLQQSMEDINYLIRLFGGEQVEFNSGDLKNSELTESFIEEEQQLPALDKESEIKEIDEHDNLSELLDLPTLSDLPELPELEDLEKIFGKDIFNEDEDDDDEDEDEDEDKEEDADENNK